MQGTVKFYNKEKGYGFIYSDETERDYFFGISDWKNSSEPKANDDIQFDIVDSKNSKKKAINIKVIKSSIIKKQEAYAKSDDRINCPSCNKRIVPRMITYRGSPEKSVCPYCSVLIKRFSYPIIDYLLRRGLGIGIVLVVAGASFLKF